ncbi:unnamed protein product [[Actinomadura] parvosata subsp. kistnae]|nr:unnamed protein product [Actinomadura parvosata subsp. kistnae]
MAVLLAAGCGATASPQRRPADTVPTRTAQRDQSTQDHAEICVEDRTRVRTEDQRCDDRQRGHSWYYVPLSATVPAIGRKAASGLPYAPPGRAYRAVRKGGSGQGVLIVDDRDRVEICVQVSTRVRVPDERCEDLLDGYAWYYLVIDRRIPAVGKRAERGSYLPPRQLTTYRARRDGGKGGTAAIRPETDEPRPTPTPTATAKKPSTRATARPTPTRPTTRPTTKPTTKPRECRTVRSGGRATTRCS